MHMCFSETAHWFWFHTFFVDSDACLVALHKVGWPGNTGWLFSGARATEGGLLYPVHWTVLPLVALCGPLRIGLETLDMF